MSKDNAKIGGKIPPQNLDAEMSLIGAILIDEEVLIDIAENVKAVDFYDNATLQFLRRLFDFMNITSQSTY